jgi:hypothetical protein
LQEFGDNDGESILCETFPGRNAFDAFFLPQSLFLLNAQGRPPIMKKHGATRWIPIEDERVRPLVTMVKVRLMISLALLDNVFMTFSSW